MGSIEKQYYPTSDIAIFVDVDGVLNSAATVVRSPEGYVGISGEKVKILRKIVTALKCQIILSSSWRKDFVLKRTDGLYLGKKFTQQGLVISGTTILDKYNSDRGLQILLYLKDHPNIKHVIILDDEFEYSFNVNGLKDNWIHTDYETGLTKADINKAIKIAKLPISEKSYEIIKNQV